MNARGRRGVGAVDDVQPHSAGGATGHRGTGGPSDRDNPRQLNARIVQCKDVDELRDLIAAVGTPALTTVNLATAVTRLAKLCRAGGGAWHDVNTDGAASDILKRIMPAATDVAARMAPQVSVY